MERLVKKLKLKRFMATLLLVCTVMSTFFTSISSVSNITVSAADSNTRRMTMLQLGNGESISSINGTENIDEGSLQILAVYLSNFYLPFITVLDGDFQEEDSSDSGNKEHVKYMEQALSQNCGMNKRASEFLVKYVLAESLSTCSPMYIRKNDLYKYWKYFDEADAVIGHSIGFYGSAITTDADVFDNTEANEWGLSSIWLGQIQNLWGNPIGYYKNGVGGNVEDDADNGFELYCRWAGVKKDTDGTKYVQVTYPMFLSIMSLCYRTASHDTTKEHLDVSGSYDISNRTDANPDEDLSDIKNSVKYEFGDPDPLTKVQRCNFYFIDGAGTPHIVFSNSEECMQAYAMVNAGADYEYGWGSSFSMLAPSDVDAIERSGGSSIQGTCVGSKLYVNWEGSIIMDAGDYRTPILPGCVNPHMMTTIDNINNKANTVPLQNIWGIQTALDGNIDVETDYKAIRVYSGNYSLFNNERWTVQPGTSDTDFDHEFFGWGDNDAFKSLLKNTDFFHMDNIYWTKKWLCFPNWHHIATSSVYSGASQSSNYYTRFAHRDLFGHTVLNTDIIFYDDLAGFDSNSQLSVMFPTMDISNEDFLNKVRELGDLDCYASFRNVTDLGHTAQYSSSLQKFFRSLFFTYCFAYFNKDYGTFDASNETMLIDLKMNPSDFPTYNMNVDWSSLYADSLDDQIKSFVYYLLHPTEGISYVATLFKNKIGGFFLRWHDDIVGSTDSNSSTGMTKYLGTSSYTTTSGLYDVPWIATVLEYYNSMIVYFIVIMVIILLCYVLTGSLSIQRSILGLVLFALLAFLPPVAINTTVNISNTFSDKVYSDKFLYWAMTQMETWLQSYAEAIESKEQGDFSTYAAFVLNNQAMTSSGVGGEVETTYSGTKVKWMTPKRYSSLSIVANKLDSIQTDASYIKTLMLGAVNSASSGETYIDSDNALYLYRDYTDIYRYGSVTYNLIKTFNFSGTLTDTSKISASRYWNLVPAVTDTGLNTIVNAWSSSNQHVVNISADIPFTPYLAGNADYSSSDSDIFRVSSSTRAVELGFLVDTIECNDSSFSHKNYFYNINNGHNQTLALSYLSLYNENILRVHQKYRALQNVCNGTVELNLGNNAVRNTSDGLNMDITSSMFNYGGKMHTTSSYADFKLGFNELIKAKDNKSTNFDSSLFRQLSSLHYSLYSESPYYFFNNNIRDQVSALTGYNYSYPDLANANADKMNNTANMLLKDNQSYFYNLSKNSGSGYGELRDYMNMHDFFYYIIPMLQDGVDLARLYDEQFGLYIDDDCSLSFNIESSSGYDTQFTYDGVKYKSLSAFNSVWNSLNEEQRYKFWHSYNTFTILLNYTAWLDTMMDCDYAKSETIRVLGEKYIVGNPLDPKSYFKTDIAGNIIEGRLMVFSRSEMAYYGLNEADLTEVERKIIKLQDTVYEEAINLMNYYTLSDETLIQAFAMMQTFEFNKEFSQTSYIKDDYVLYPQGYELKAFSYDAYLRMIISESSGESLMSGGGTADDGSVEANTSIYKRVLNNTSLFFALFLLLNDVFAVYLIPGLKLFFIVCIFFTSIALIIAAVVKLEMNMLKVMWHSLFAPLLGFSAVSMGMSFIVSLFLGNGADGVASSSLVINLGDPTTAIIVMIIINVGATILYFKICKKCFHDFKTYIKAVFDNVSATVVGAVGAVAGAVTTGKVAGKVKGRAIGIDGLGVPSTARQRGRDNSPTSGKTGIGGSFASGAAAGAGFGLGKEYMSEKTKEALEANKQREDAKRGMNKYNAKAYDKATAKSDKFADKKARLDNRLRAENLSEGKRKRLEKARNKMDARISRANNNADNISKYGRFGAMHKRIGTAASTAKKTASKGLGKAKATAKSGMSRAQSLANTASTNAKKAGRFVKSGGVGRAVGAGAGRVANGASATANFVRQSPQNIKKGARAVGTTVSNGAKQAASYTARTVREAPVAVKKASMSALRQGLDAGRGAYKSTVATGRRVATGVADVTRRNVSEGKKSYTNTRK